jgi:hypothetical protein
MILEHASRQFVLHGIVAPPPQKKKKNKLTAKDI